MNREKDKIIKNAAVKALKFTNYTETLIEAKVIKEEKQKSLNKKV